MNKREALRVAPSRDGVSIWSAEIFGDADVTGVRDFLSRSFSVQEVEGVELRRASAFGRIRYGAASNPARIWKKLSRALRSSEDEEPQSGLHNKPNRRIDAALVYLDGPFASQVRVTRVGDDALTTWRVLGQGKNALYLWHPALRHRRDVVYRLEEELAAILGVESFRASALTGSVSIRFDRRALTVERLVRELEKAWPKLLAGLAGPPSQKRLVAAVGLLGLAFTGQYLAPAVRPIAIAGVTLFNVPNVVSAGKQLTHGQIGLSALYTTGLAFMLASGLPFSATVFATLMQFWPQLVRKKLVDSQRRLFAGQRRRPAWARIALTAVVEGEVPIEDLRTNDLIIVRSGELVPVDGVVTAGHAAVVDDASFGAQQLSDKSQGDAVRAGAWIRDGSLTIRVERTGPQTIASYIDSLLPHSAIPDLPSSLEAERIANRNAKPALALCATSFALTRTLRLSQALIRPDYATAPRLSAQLSALHGIAQGLQRGLLFRNPAALDRLANVEVFVIDDSAGLDRRAIEIAKVETVQGVSAKLVVGYALASQQAAHTEQSSALSAFTLNRHASRAQIGSIGRYAGVVRYRDHRGSTIEIATAQYLTAAKIAVPRDLAPQLARRTPASGVHEDAALRPLWVIRDAQLIGVVSFARTGESIGKQPLARLQAQHASARFVYLSGQAQSEASARALGIEVCHGGLSSAAKVDLIRGLGRNVLWIGDGSDARVSQSIVASTVSVSVAPLSRAREDAADILLPGRGLDALLEVMQLGSAHAKRLAQDYRTVYVVNLLGVAGAFLTRFTGLQAGLLSNFGTGIIYVRHARNLDRLASVAEANRSRLMRSSRG
jgi:cation-transporting P-type ATPase C